MHKTSKLTRFSQIKNNQCTVKSDSDINTNIRGTAGIFKLNMKVKSIEKIFSC